MAAYDTIGNVIVVERDVYFEILDLVESAREVTPEAFIALVTQRYELSYISYLDVLPHAGMIHFRRSHHNFPIGWVIAYRKRALYRHDIVLHEGMRSVAPLDWPTLRRAYPASDVVFSAAETFGVPDTGMTFPQVSHGRSSAMFSFMVDVPHSEWAAYKRSNLRDLQSLAILFHAKVQPLASMEAPLPQLTEREAEVLRWSAAGKSYWEISMILGVSERTIRFFMTNARQKLNVVTNAQAVAMAIWHGLIPPV